MERIVTDNGAYPLAPYVSDEELQRALRENAEAVFGPDAFYVDRSRLGGLAGVQAVPDGYLLRFVKGKAVTCAVVEVELSTRSFAENVLPQVVRVRAATASPEGRRAVALALWDKLRGHKKLLTALKAAAGGLDAHVYLADRVLAATPRTVIVLDRLSERFKVGLEQFPAELFELHKYSPPPGSRNLKPVFRVVQHGSAAAAPSEVAGPVSTIEPKRVLEQVASRLRKSQRVADVEIEGVTVNLYPKGRSDWSVWLWPFSPRRYRFGVWAGTKLLFDHYKRSLPAMRRDLAFGKSEELSIFGRDTIRQTVELGPRELHPDRLASHLARYFNFFRAREAKLETLART